MYELAEQYRKNQRQQAKRKLLSIIGTIGIGDTLALLAEISEEFGEGDIGGRATVPPDAEWMAIAAFTSSAADTVSEIVQRGR